MAAATALHYMFMDVCMICRQGGGCTLKLPRLRITCVCANAETAVLAVCLHVEVLRQSEFSS
eukprot:19638-Heterococcus_DN1.PRE.4